MRKKAGKQLPVPEIEIKYSPKLDPIFLGHMRHESKHKGSWQKWKPWSKEQAEKRVEEYKKEWGKYEKRILEGMCDVIGVNFYKNVIGVYVVIPSMRNFSDPIVIRGTDSPRQFVVTLTHELLHELLPYTEDEESPHAVYFKIFKEMVSGDHRKTMIFHVVTYAVMQYLFKDVVRDEKLWSMAVERAVPHKDYKGALDVIEKRGYMEIIQEFREKFEAHKKTTP